jgi:hypothetical protein
VQLDRRVEWDSRRLAEPGAGRQIDVALRPGTVVRGAMLRIIDATHFIDEDGNLPLEPPPLRRIALWVARLVEYGGPLARGELRATLVECTSRPGRRPCPGLLGVEKTERDEIIAFCVTCGTKQAVIHGWEETPWAEGPIAPAPRSLFFDDPGSGPSATSTSAPGLRAGADTVHELRIAIQGIEPPIWRSVLVPSDIPLPKLHRVLNEAMGWENRHLHEFVAGGRRYGSAGPEVGDSNALPERNVRLLDIAPAVGARFTYAYDFGDDWEHDVAVTRVLPAEEAGRVPACIGGARACPREDSGGPWSYQANLEAFRDPRHPEHAEVRRWMGRRFDPEAFDVAAADRRVARVR